ncbi:uncharacterized protein Z520_04505 [Fonsecaea multimorphosa CBS 102226]|uniref:DUF7820 domain-containing protein n=1 Tax=Fonsecaea multimorphosa CBS 102226 TaxID=1442371 RepID=A0A0D2K9N9_9EURO|nr:uncharacterized protein Z520_04505 [Fonsecaea multimorphosa CBS 102226]KIX99869.1 hypothetical protein Z520_04505 [Fonsecaea multimorphosa CBS 102226]OAL26346.1 hypothetical protein AYO22_04264 [Fonsecaea multimorphosa]
MARRPPSRRSTSMEDDTPRMSSIETPNPNVFSDDYAVDPAESIGTASPTDSIGSRPEELNLDQRNHAINNPREYTPAGLPGNTFGLNRLSVSKRNLPAESSAHPHRAVSTSSRSIADTRRSLSTSSRFSIPRAQSPYRGPTAPSQPYGLYPQVTRASSVISDSTIRPLELPFVPQGGPEHPYSMYPQNTVPEDDSSDIGLGFPGMGQSYPSPDTSSSSNEVGDIVGSDGHIEQLPPYSRYADNVIAKGDMARIDPQTSTITEESGPALTLQPPEASASDVELTAVGPGPSQDEVARKEGLREKRRRRTCCGLPIWTIVVVTAIVVLAAVIGGVIGGLVGNQHGTHQAEVAATTTVWLDADPAQTGPSTPSCPTGHYTIPLNQTEDINSCVIDHEYSHTWACLDFALLGINVFANGPNYSVVFDDYSVRPQLFRYGPQPPDFNGTSFSMQPYNDKEDDQLGVALFFSVLFDKLIIVPADQLSPEPGPMKRSVSALELAGRGLPYPGANYLSIGDKPWYCFWNSSVSEFWVFLDQNMNDAYETYSSTSTITSVSSNPTNTGSHSMTQNAPVYGSGPTTTNPSTTTPYPSDPTDADYWAGTKVKRQATGGSPDYPKLVKMVEKRKPDNNVQPYCQQMQVLNNWQIMPIPNVPTICIDESDYGTPTPGPSKKRMIRRGPPNTVEQLGSNCICEWFSV